MSCRRLFSLWYNLGSFVINVVRLSVVKSSFSEFKVIIILLVWTLGGSSRV